jgi:hypothetical protein
MKIQKVRLRFGLAVGLTCLLGGLALLIGYRSVWAINGFSPNQELPLAPLAPVGGPSGPVAFINRALEPSIRVSPAPDNTVYVSSIRGVPGGVDLWRSFSPLDGGPNPDGTYHFKYEGQPDGCGVLAGGCTLLGIREGGGDVDIAVNYPSSGVPNLALVSLLLAPGVTGTHSTDRGDTFSQPNPAVALIPGDDRQWIEGFGGQNVYLNYHDAGTFQIDVQRSTDGGSTYANGFGQAIDPATFPAAGGVPATNSANVAGQIRIDRSSCPSRGNLYQIFVAPDNAVENAAGRALRSVYSGVSKDAKLGLPVFMFTDHKIFAGPAGLRNEGAVNLFPALATDALGFVYAVWSDNSNILFSSSSDHGTTWTTPLGVNLGATVGEANVFPWVAADANGHVGIVWFGGDRAGNSNDASIHAPCPMDSTDCMKNWTNWNVYYAETVNGHATTPSFVQSVISDHIIHRGTISTGGLGGGANRNLGDLFQIAFDSQHRANVAFSDDHLVNREVGPDNGPDNPTTRRKIRANFTHQLMGNPRVVTEEGACAGSPQEVEEEDEGDGEDNEHDHASFVDEKQPHDNGTLVYNDPSKNLNLQSSNGVQGISYSGSCVSFNGNSKVNGQLGYAFTFRACDLSALGGIANFSISVTGPAGFAYQKSGTFTTGFVKLHVKL